MKSYNEYNQRTDCSDGYAGTCKSCIYARQKQRVKENGNKDRKKYLKTQRGYVGQTYSNMLGRVKGRVKPHLYKGLPILDRIEFYDWSLNNSIFINLFKIYTDSGFDKKFAPSIDRIDSTRGYSIDNIRWLSHSENSRLGAISKHKGE